MSHESDSSFDPRLIDLHLGQLPARERAAVEAEVASSRELSEQHAMLSDAIAALASLYPAWQASRKEPAAALHHI